MTRRVGRFPLESRSTAITRTSGTTSRLSGSANTRIAAKSTIYCTDRRKLQETNFQINEGELMKVDNFIYLGLPIGDSKFVTSTFEKKFSATERAYFALRRFGLHKKWLHLTCLCFMYRKYCQSISLYGLELVTLSKASLQRINTCQNTLLKMGIGVPPKYSKSTPLL